MKGKWPVLFLIWLMMLVAYFDRVNVAVAGPTISHALNLTKTQFGWVLAAFTLGYALLQVPGGYIADRFGPRIILVVAILVWSFFTAATGMVASLAALLLVRVAFGVGEGLENGAQFKLIGDYFEPVERSRANAFFLTALALGPALATPSAAWLLEHRGLREMFYWFAVLGLCVGVLLYLFLPRTPRRSAAELREARRPELLQALKHKTPWLCFATYLFFNGAFWGFVGWIPSYLRETRHLTLSKLGFLGAAPYLCGFLAMIVVGQLGSSGFVHRRSLLVSTCYLGAAVSLYFALNAGTTTGSIVGLSVAASFLYGSFGPFWAIAIDQTSLHNRGALSGFVNFGGQIGGFLAQIAIGKLFDLTGSFSGGLTYMMVSLVFGAIAATILGRHTRRTADRASAPA